MILFSPVGSRNYANHTATQVNDLEKKMTATSGLKCLEQFEKFNRPGLWAKTFAALLIGQTGWYSKRCRLIWRLKGTKYNRFYFQLVPSTHHIEETEFGLLPTPKATEIEEYYPDWKKRMVASGNPKNVGKTTTNIGTMARSGMLPTPTTRDYKGARTKEALKKAGRNETNNLPDAFSQHGKSSQLNPQFVLEMMGFPPDWTELPFLNGETNLSKEQATQ